jgi:long-subunit fatty acid transport protein
MEEGEMIMILLKIILFITVIAIYPLFSQTANDAIRIRQNEIGFGARTLAMGGNGVALANDYSALYWNPAGLAYLRFSEISGEFSHLRFNNAADFANNSSEFSNNFTRFRNFGIAIPMATERGSLVIAMGYNYVKDFDDYLSFSGFNQQSNGLEFYLRDDQGNYGWYPFDRDVTQSEEVTVEGGLHQWAFGGALALSPNFDFGVSMQFWRGQEDYNLYFLQEDSENIYTSFPADFFSYSVNDNIISRYKAFSVKMGGMFKLNPATRLGLAVEFPTTFSITEDYTSSDELIFDDGYVDPYEYEPATWEYKVKTPYRFDAGLGIQLANLRVNGSATFQDWQQVRFVVPENRSFDSDYQELISENSIIQKNYRSTLNYHVGGEFYVPYSNIYLRGGYAVYPSPLKDATSDLDKIVYSGGVGIRIGKSTFLDATYLQSSWKRESEDIFTPGGTLEDITEGRVFLGIRVLL